mmetsp:Transcript_36219/g.90545  ORF Transcript_36219/g.90545 Transcript_36219/m.90545 type:complete len:482 (-) Transcript_36219:29-1474(-)
MRRDRRWPMTMVVKRPQQTGGGEREHLAPGAHTYTVQLPKCGSLCRGTPRTQPVKNHSRVWRGKSVDSLAHHSGAGRRAKVSKKRQASTQMRCSRTRTQGFPTRSRPSSPIRTRALRVRRAVERTVFKAGAVLPSLAAAGRIVQRAAILAGGRRAALLRFGFWLGFDGDLGGLGWGGGNGGGGGGRGGGRIGGGGRRAAPVLSFVGHQMVERCFRESARVVVLALLAVHGKDLAFDIVNDLHVGLEGSVPLATALVIGQHDRPLVVRLEVPGGHVCRRCCKVTGRVLQANCSTEAVVDKIPRNLREIAGALDALHVGEERPVCVLHGKIKAKGLKQNALADEDLLFQLEEFLRLGLGCLLLVVLRLIRLHHDVLELLGRLLHFGGKEETRRRNGEAVVVLVGHAGVKAVKEHDGGGDAELREAKLLSALLEERARQPTRDVLLLPRTVHIATGLPQEVRSRRRLLDLLLCQVGRDEHRPGS